jgi:hypothetical protein
MKGLKRTCFLMHNCRSTSRGEIPRARSSRLLDQHIRADMMSARPAEPAGLSGASSAPSATPAYTTGRA